MPRVKRAVERLKGLVDSFPALPRPWRAEPQEIATAEQAFEGVHTTVRPSDSFRDHLRHNLELAAQHAVSGPEIEYSKPMYRELVIGVSAGVLAAGLTALLVRLYWPHAGAEQ